MSLTSGNLKLLSTVNLHGRPVHIDDQHAHPVVELERAFETPLPTYVLPNILAPASHVLLSNGFQTWVNDLCANYKFHTTHGSQCFFQATYVNDRDFLTFGITLIDRDCKPLANFVVPVLVLCSTSITSLSEPKYTFQPADLNLHGSDTLEKFIQNQLLNRFGILMEKIVNDVATYIASETELESNNDNEIINEESNEVIVETVEETNQDVVEEIAEMMLEASPRIAEIDIEVPIVSSLGDITSLADGYGFSVGQKPPVCEIKEVEIDLNNLENENNDNDNFGKKCNCGNDCNCDQNNENNNVYVPPEICYKYKNEQLVDLQIQLVKFQGLLNSLFRLQVTTSTGHSNLTQYVAEDVITDARDGQIPHGVFTVWYRPVFSLISANNLDRYECHQKHLRDALDCCQDEKERGILHKILHEIEKFIDLFRKHNHPKHEVKEYLNLILPDPRGSTHSNPTSARVLDQHRITAINQHIIRISEPSVFALGATFKFNAQLGRFELQNVKIAHVEKDDITARWLNVLYRLFQRNATKIFAKHVHAINNNTMIALFNGSDRDDPIDSLNAS